MSDPIPLPIEEWSRALGVRLADRLRGWLPRRWRANPLLLREAGLREGQTIWRSPFALMLVVLVVFLIELQVSHALYQHFRRAQQLPRFFLGGSRAIEQLLLLVPPYLCARAWARERHSSQRDQLAASPLTLWQIIEAKTLLWLAPFVIFQLVRVLGMEIWFFIVRWMNGQGIVNLLSQWGGDAGFLGGFACWGIQQFLVMVGFVGAPFFALGLITRLTLVWWHPLLSVVLLWGGKFAIHRLSFFVLGEFYRAWPGRSSLFTMLLTQFLITAVGIGLAVAVWWRLPRHVARVYGLEDQGS